MKKHVCLLSGLFSLCIFSQAQIKQGAILAGGDISVYTSSEKSDAAGLNNKMTDLSFSPYFGKAVKQDLVAGFSLLYTHADQNNAAQTLNGYGAGLFIRRYKFLGNRFYIFLQAGVNGEYNTEKFPANTTTPYETNGKGFNASLSIYPGVSYSITDKWQLELAIPNFANLQYSHFKTTTDPSSGDESSNSSFSASTMLSSTNTLSLGVSFLLNK